MKAVVCPCYGPPEVLRIQEAPKPAPRAGQLLIKVRAVDITASDCIIRGFKLSRWSIQGLMMGLVLGFRGPRRPILGMVFAGEVESVGENVRTFQPGDAVFGSTLGSGMQFGAYAEYLCVPENSLVAHIPAQASVVEAAAIPYGSGLSLHFLKKGSLRRGQKILIYGASGAIGSASVQLAKQHFGAEVTGVCSTQNLELVSSLGADRVIDYTCQTPAARNEHYDFILDAVGKRKVSSYKKICTLSLAPGGRFISVDDGSPRFIQDHLILARDLCAAGKYHPVIDRCYPLDQIVEAHRYVDTGHKRGSVLVTIQ